MSALGLEKSEVTIPFSLKIYKSQFVLYLLKRKKLEIKNVQLNNPTQDLYKARPCQLKYKSDQRSVCAAFWCCPYASVIRLEFDWIMSENIKGSSTLRPKVVGCRIKNGLWRVNVVVVVVIVLNLGVN
jgi:hypothetical protein